MTASARHLGPVLLLACSCAAVLQGSRQTLALDSQPEGAKVYLDGLRIGQTPMQVVAQASKDYSFEFRLDGYATQRVTSQDFVGLGWVGLDVLLIPTVFFSWGIIVDALTGDWFSFEPLDVIMQPIAPLARPAQTFRSARTSETSPTARPGSG